MATFAAIFIGAILMTHWKELTGQGYYPPGAGNAYNRYSAAPGQPLLNNGYGSQLRTMVFGYNPDRFSGSSPGTCRATTADVDGPYYKSSAPFQDASSNIPPAVCANTPAMDRVFINGTIRLQNSAGDCGTPVRALVDVWQADANGAYSSTDLANSDYTCRTRFYTNADGRYIISSVFPGRYPCYDCDISGYRPAHIHFKITPLDGRQIATGPTFTTQLYFAQDHYLSPVDACFACGSGQPSQITHVENYADIKTFEGTWDVLLSVSAIQPQPNQLYRAA